MVVLESSRQTCMTYTSAECKMENPDDGHRNCPKHVEFLDKNKFGKLARLLVLLKNRYYARSHECKITRIYILLLFMYVAYRTTKLLCLVLMSFRHEGTYNKINEQ
jgi:hypothetical protein